MASYSSSSRYVPTISSTGAATATRTPPRATKFASYVSVEGDTFERLATMVFQDPQRYWEIADINTNVAFPDFIPVGTRIRIPLA